MIHRLSSTIRSLLRDDETVEIVACGGFAAVREHFVITNQRLIVARILGTRMAATVFDRSKDVWMELRPNDTGTDLIVCSAETMERVRRLPETDRQLLQHHLGLETGEFEEYPPPTEGMYAIFSDHPGTRDSCVTHTLTHSFLVIITIILFILLAYECGKLVGPLRGGEGTAGWWLIFISLYLSATLVKSTLHIATLVAVGVPSFVKGAMRAGTHISLAITHKEACAIGLFVIGAWLLASILQKLHRELGAIKLYPPSIPCLATNSLATIVLIVASVYHQSALSPWEHLRFVRRLPAIPSSSTEFSIWRGTPDRAILYDDSQLTLTPISHDEGRSWTTWNLEPSPPSTTRWWGRFVDGWFARVTGTRIDLFHVDEDMQSWSFVFPQPSGRIIVPDDVLIRPRHNSLFVIASTGETAHLDLTHGQQRWLRRFPEDVGSSFSDHPRIIDQAGDLLIIELPGRAAYAVNVESGEIAWRLELHPSTRELMVTSDLVVVMDDEMIRIHSLPTGEPQWSSPVPGLPATRPFPSFCNELVGMIVKSRGLHAVFFDPFSGDMKRTSSMGFSTEDEMDFSNLEQGCIHWSRGVWYLGSPTAPDGWTYVLSDEGTQIIDGPLVYDKRLYYSTSSGFFEVRCSDTGDHLWRYRMRGPMLQRGIGVSLRGPMIVTKTGYLYAFHR